MNLSEKKCRPCEGGIPKLNSPEIIRMNNLLETQWDVVDDMKIVREFEFKDFVSTMEFVNKAADIAEMEGHHPVIHVYYGKCIVELWTHAILGLSENDFILASKYNDCY